MSATLEHLIHAYMDGTIAVEEMAQLNAFLLHDDGARREFTEMLNMDSALAAMAAGYESPVVQQQAAAPHQTSQKIRPRPFPLRARWLAVAAAACLVALLAGGWWWQFAQQPFATVESAAGVTSFAPGMKLRGERHELSAGTLSLITKRGAHVVIEAPAMFQFESAQRLRVTRGRLAADVPPSAKGFTVVTPSGDAIDLGTRFGVDVPADGDAEIHVFQGEVIARAHGAKQQQSVRGGDAVTMAHGSSATRELRTAAFIQPDEMSSLTAGLAAGQRAQAEAAVDQLRKDPALIALLDFESETSAGGDGVYRIVQGRWPGSRAPEFTHVGDHLKLDVGGDRSWPQLTLAAWVRIDRLGEPYQSLLHTDGWSRNNPGQVHWMITGATTMRLALIGNTLTPGAEERQGYPNSRTSVLPEQGRWMHVATVYDASTGTVRFFLNGRFDKETKQQVANPARLGPAQIGNWNQKDRKLSGRVDELLILGRAMSDDEVRALHAAGNPYR